MAQNTALVVGATGIVGLTLAEHLAVQPGHTVYGLARRPRTLEGVQPIATDLRDPAAVKSAIGGLGITHAYFTTWLRQENEAKNCEVNGGMLSNLLDALVDSPLRHVGLVTGGKTYFGSFEDSGSFDVTTPFREEQERKPGLNFYYTQEDILWERARRQGFTWNVHRPPTIIGYAVGNAMNMGVTLALYASICKAAGRPFVFPGVPQQYRGLFNVVDAEVLAHQIQWAASTPAARDLALNVGNGDLFRWDWMWPKIAAYFELPAAPYPGHATPLDEQMKDAAPVWDRIVAEHGLKAGPLEELASWWHTDSDLGRPFDNFADLSRSRVLGFGEYRESFTSFTRLFDRLRSERLIP